MLTIAAVNSGNYLGMGAVYMNCLHRGVARNLTLPHRFVCFTDDPTGLDQAIEARPLPHPGLKGWFNKLALFKPGVFEWTDRVLFLDLDTVICGSLDDIASYDGEFALLEDVMFPGRWGSGVMAWRGGACAQIWEEYVRAGYPLINGGDQAWIKQVIKKADLLQDLYPNQIASYKVSAGVLSPYTRIVCFHGRPRPHEITSGWVPALWSQQKETS